MAERDIYRAPGELAGIRTMALGVGAVATIAWAVGLYLNPEQGLRSWLLAFMFWGGIGFGAIGLLILQYLTGGAWGVVIRRTLEASSRTLPLIAIFFLPLAIGITSLYEWTHLPPTDHVIEARGWYMTPSGWIIRSVVCFALFGVMAYLLNKWSANQDASKDHEEAATWLGKATAFSGPTMVFFALVVTLVAVDWVMTLEPHWFSTIFGLLNVIGWALSCLCFSVIVLAFLHDKVPMDHVLGKRHFHDFGKLMLAMVMVWAYFNFSQYLIIYSGNIPEETVWFIKRSTGGWGWMAWALILFHFAVPFLILLQQDLKRKPKKLALVAIFILFMRIVDSFWYIGPSPRIHAEGIAPTAFIVSWMDFAAPIGMGGFWVAYFINQLTKRPLVPVMDPFLEKAIEHGHGH
ncbi:MAG TPA: hypothetical protein VJV05_17345 [Pyrinomonadaceae bacterium]|nr:hypothetical protein [Pyrinomonadaceae bacterium]